MKNYFKSLQAEIWQAFQSSKIVGHFTVKGQEREIITSRFLARHMPSFVEIGQGVLVDQSTTDFSSLTQSTSPQIDILLSMSHHPSLTFYGGTRFFFAESVAAVIEVKSKLTTYESKKEDSELDAILKHCSKVKQRTRQIVGLFSGNAPSNKVPYYVIAFEADKGAEELINVLKRRADIAGLTDEQRKEYPPDGIFILGPSNSGTVIKHISDHQIRPANFSDNCFAGGVFPNGGVLLNLWLTLFNRINDIRLLEFPSVNYAKKVLDINE